MSRKYSKQETTIYLLYFITTMLQIMLQDKSVQYTTSYLRTNWEMQNSQVHF